MSECTAIQQTRQQYSEVCDQRSLENVADDFGPYNHLSAQHAWEELGANFYFACNLMECSYIIYFDLIFSVEIWRKCDSLRWLLPSQHSCE